MSTVFGKRLKELRKIKGLTQKELGKRVQLAESTIGMYERGERSPDIETLVNFATILMATTDYLTGKSNHPRLTSDEDREYDQKTMELIKIVEELPKDIQEQFWRNAELMKKHLENKQ